MACGKAMAQMGNGIIDTHHYSTHIGSSSPKVGGETEGESAGRPGGRGCEKGEGNRDREGTGEASPMSKWIMESLTLITTPLHFLENPRCTGSKRIMRNRLRQVQGRSGQLPGSREYRGETEYSTRTVSKRKIYKYLISTQEYRGETDKKRLRRTGANRGHP